MIECGLATRDLITSGSLRMFSTRADHVASSQLQDRTVTSQISSLHGTLRGVQISLNYFIQHKDNNWGYLCAYKTEVRIIVPPA